MAVVPLHSLYGEPATKNTSALFVSEGGAKPAPPGGGEYVSPRAGRCEANEDTCMGFRVSDSKFCVGHTRAAKVRAEREQG